MDAPPLSPESQFKTRWSRVGIMITLAVFLFFAADLGIRWRHWVWDTTAPIRFTADIDRGYFWGRTAAREGMLNQYDKMQMQQPTDALWLDYAPLRLMLMTLWGRWSLIHFPHVDTWHEDHSYQLTAPMLRFNFFMEAVGLVAAFLLTRLWVIRRNPVYSRPLLPDFVRGFTPAVFAMLLLWFNPAIVLSGYGWPTWDLWVIPIFLLVALLASVDCWFVAGIVLGIGAMLKGQQFIALPVFAIWALVLGKPVSILRFAGGACVAIALIVSPWLLTYIPADKLTAARELQATFGHADPLVIGTFRIDRVVDWPAIFWLACVATAAFGLPIVSRITFVGKTNGRSRFARLIASPWFWRVLVVVGMVLLIYWPWLIRRNHADWRVGFLTLLVMSIPVFFVRPRGLVVFTAIATATAMLMCMRVFSASTAWFDCGIRFGALHWPRMVMGLTDNLPGILVADFNWPWDSLVTPITVPAHLLWFFPAREYYLTIKTVLLRLFWGTLVLSSLGLGMQARRRDSRVLIALVTPWLMFFCFAPQIHERYLVYAAGLSCLCAGTSVGMALLGVFLSLVTTLMTLHAMLVSAAEHGQLKAFGAMLAGQFPALFNKNAGEKLLNFANGTNPDLGYAVILCGLIFLYFSLAPRGAAMASLRSNKSTTAVNDPV